MEVTVETTEEVAAWYETLPSAQRAQALDVGLGVLARGHDGPVRLQDLSLAEAYVEAFGEYTLLAVSHARADSKLGELEQEENRLHARLARLRASVAGTPPSAAPPAPAPSPTPTTAPTQATPATPSPPSRLRVPTRKVDVCLSPGQVALLESLTGETRADPGETGRLLAQALAYGCAASVVSGLDGYSEGLARLISRVRGRAAALNYELWARQYDSRVVQLHINALRAEISFFAEVSGRTARPAPG
ncbi:MAG: hypothetical protein AB1503_06530 [Bacillota bacterium]